MDLRRVATGLVILVTLSSCSASGARTSERSRADERIVERSPTLPDPASAPDARGRPDREAAARLAVNRVEPIAGGLRLSHPRRTVDFTSDGVRVWGVRGAPDWRWTLASVRSSAGAELVAIEPVTPVRAVDGNVRYDRGRVREEYRFDTNSFEQRFVVPSALPLAGGDLVVTGTIRSGGRHERGPERWQWRGDGAEVWLGDARVFDADGRVIPCSFDVSATATRLVVNGAALASAAYPVTIDPEIGSNDVRISDMGPNGDPAYDAFKPAVAYNSINDTYVVVWEGDDSTGGLVEGETEIFGQVITASGSQTGYSDVRISYAGGTGTADYKAHDPAIAFNSTYGQFLVVWSADSPDGDLVDGEFEIWGQVVDAYLFPQYGGNFRISTMGPDGDRDYDANRPSATYNPSPDEYLVVWDGDTNTGGLVDEENEIWAQRVYSTGVPVGSNLRISDMGGTGDPAYDAIQPDVTFNTEDLEYLIVWTGDDDSGSLVDDEFEIYAQLMDQFGGGVGTNDARVSDMGGTGDPTYGAYAPAVAYNPKANQYLVVWLGDDDVGGLVDNEFEVFSQRMDAALGGLGSNDYRVSDAGGVGDATYQVMWGPDVVYNPIDDEYMAVWSGEDTVDGMVNNEWEVFAQRMTGTIVGAGPNDERVSDAGGLGNTTYQTQEVAVAANAANGQFLVVWGGDDNTGTLVNDEEEIFIQRMKGWYVFADDFESGNIDNWGSSAP
ncbi:MAG: hypothetical protein U0610_03325 [bacterium]